MIGLESELLIKTRLIIKKKMMKAGRTVVSRRFNKKGEGFCPPLTVVPFSLSRRREKVFALFFHLFLICHLLSFSFLP